MHEDLGGSENDRIWLVAYARLKNIEVHFIMIGIKLAKFQCFFQIASPGTHSFKISEYSKTTPWIPLDFEIC